GKDQERYATIMLMVAQISEVMTAGQNALDTRPQGSSATWNVLVLQAESARTEVAPYDSDFDSATFSMPKEESEPLYVGGAQMKPFEETFVGLRELLHKVDEKASRMLGGFYKDKPAGEQSQAGDDGSFHY